MATGSHSLAEAGARKGKKRTEVKRNINLDDPVVLSVTATLSPPSSRLPIHKLMFYYLS